MRWPLRYFCWGHPKRFVIRTKCKKIRSSKPFSSVLKDETAHYRDVNSKTPPVPDWKQEEKEDELELTVDDIEEGMQNFVPSYLFLLGLLFLTLYHYLEPFSDFAETSLNKLNKLRGVHSQLVKFEKFLYRRRMSKLNLMPQFVWTAYVGKSLISCAAQEEELKHDDEIGEAISEEEESNLQQMIIQLVRGASPEQGRNPRFPGSQPVSLARANLDMLNNERYWVTWKVDNISALQKQTQNSSIVKPLKDCQAKQQMEFDYVSQLFCA